MSTCQQDKMCRQLASQISYGNKSSFQSTIMSTSGIPQKHKYIHGLQHVINIAPCSLVPTILHKFYDSKGHQITIFTSEAVQRSYWWPKLWQDIVEYVGKCSVCAKHLPYKAKYPQQHLEIPQLPITVLAMDSRDHLPITSKGNRRLWQQFVWM